MDSNKLLNKDDLGELSKTIQGVKTNEGGKTRALLNLVQPTFQSSQLD